LIKFSVLQSPALKIGNAEYIIMEKNPKKILRVVKILNKKYKIKPGREDPFKVLIGTILSQRTKDELTWPTNEKLFRVANTPEKFSQLPVKKIARLIYPVGFYNQKAKRIKQVARILIDEYDSKVPRDKKLLMELPGVGPKTASIVLAYGFGIPAVAVDTHVNRVSKRLGIVPENIKPEQTQEVLEKLIPRKNQIIVNHLLVSFGKEVCQPRKPRCYMCPIVKLCAYEPKNFLK
jgi:endonuclease-3